jgi:hypothetical protein
MPVRVAGAAGELPAKGDVGAVEKLLAAPADAEFGGTAEVDMRSVASNVFRSSTVTESSSMQAT